MGDTLELIGFYGTLLTLRSSKHDRTYAIAISCIMIS